jgi:hypothetical protein
MADYNYIKVYAESEQPLYILRMDKGSEDEVMLVDLFLEHRVKFEKSSKEEYDTLIVEGGDQYVLTSDELLDEHAARGFTEDKE